MYLRLGHYFSQNMYNIRRGLKSPESCHVASRRNFQSSGNADSSQYGEESPNLATLASAAIFEMVITLHLTHPVRVICVHRECGCGFRAFSHSILTRSFGHILSKEGAR